LSYAFTNKIKHISRIHISDKYQIVINTPEVHFGKTRSDAEVEHKNLNLFSFKKY
jgi:hypothetical protein